MSQINKSWVKREVHDEVHNICEEKIKQIEDSIGNLTRKIVAIQFDKDVALVKLETLKGILDIIDSKSKDIKEED